MLLLKLSLSLTTVSSSIEIIGVGIAQLDIYSSLLSDVITDFQ